MIIEPIARAPNTCQPPKSIFEIVFRAFIPAPAIPAVSPNATLVGDALPPSAVVIGLSGDGRDVSYAGGTYRAEIIAHVTTDPSRGPLLGAPILHLGESAQWGSNQIEHAPCFPWWWFDILPGMTTSKRRTLAATPENLDVEAIQDTSDPDLVHIRLTMAAPLAADDPSIAAAAPRIDADVVVSIWEKAGQPPVFSAEGFHDGFPAYELFVNGETLYSYNPRNNADIGLLALFGALNRQEISTANVIIPGVALSC